MMSDLSLSPAQAIATVTSADFIPGTVAMLGSFLAKNPWFSGDIIVIHDGLDERLLTSLRDSFPNLLTQEIGDQLSQRLDAISAAAPWLGNKRLQFASLEIVAFDSYDSLLFFDSDLLFLNSIEDLVLPGQKEGLICCGDGAYHRGNARRADDFTEISCDPVEEGCLHNTFNSGFMILPKKYLGQDRYLAFLDLLVPERWAEDTTGHTDQMLFNMLFAGQQKIVSPMYNYALLHRKIIEDRSGLTPADAHILHFNGAAKPWLPAEILRQSAIDQAILPASRLWNKAYKAALKRHKFENIST